MTVALDALTGGQLLERVVAELTAPADMPLALERVLTDLGDATACTAARLYVRNGDMLSLHAAAGRQGRLAGQVEVGLDESFAGWVTKTRTPAVVSEDALADPRVKFVPELNEGLRAIVALPLLGQDGEAIGAVLLHRRDSHPIGEEVLAMLEPVAAVLAVHVELHLLRAGADGRIRRLSDLSALLAALAAAPDRAAICRVATEGVRALLDADECALQLVEHDTGETLLAAHDPPATRPVLARPSALVERTDVAFAPIGLGDARIGALAVRRERALTIDERALLDAVAHQLAPALARLELVDRLDAEHDVRGVFEAFARDAHEVAYARAREVGVNLRLSYVVVVARPPADDERPWRQVARELDRGLRAAAPGCACETTSDGLRALAHGVRFEAVAEVARAAGVAVGVSDIRQRPEHGHRAEREARDACRVAGDLIGGGGALAYADLGVYRYLVRLEPDELPDDGVREAVAALLEYDRRRSAELVKTLEALVLHRGNTSATARALVVHPNTLRQRLRRIETLTGLDAQATDFGQLDLALKLVRLGA